MAKLIRRRTRGPLLYDQIYSASYEAGLDFHNPLRPTKGLAKKFLADVKIPAGAKAVELGCGEGRDTILLAKHRIAVVGLDISRSALRRAKRRAAMTRKKLSLVFADMSRPLGFRSEVFDLAVNIDSIHLVADDKARLRHFREAYRILKLRGLFFLCAHTGRRDARESGGNETRALNVSGSKKSVLVPRLPSTVRTPRGYERELESAGFKIVWRKTECINDPIPVKTCIIIARKSSHRGKVAEK